MQLLLHPCWISEDRSVGHKAYQFFSSSTVSLPGKKIIPSLINCKFLSNLEHVFLFYHIQLYLFTIPLHWGVSVHFKYAVWILFLLPGEDRGEESLGLDQEDGT